MGPDLAGAYRRRIGVAPGFAYSPGLMRRHGRWDDYLLSEFLEDPQGFAPGTTMVFKGIPSEKEREALIAYMKGL
jgi:cytochrome c